MQYHVITLQKTPKRLLSFYNTNPYLKKLVEPYLGFDGQNSFCTLETYSAEFHPDIGYSKGAIGCALSHIDLWRSCAKGFELFTIFEDDAIIHKDFVRHQKRILRELKDECDLIVWGWNFNCPMQFQLLENISPAYVQTVEHNIADNGDRFQESVIAPTVFDLQFCFGTPAYTITPMGARRLLHELLPLRNFTLKTDAFDALNTGIDVAMIKAYSSIGAKVCIPPIALTPNTLSESLTK